MNFVTNKEYILDQLKLLIRFSDAIDFADF